jgi:hypothetical protein
MQLSLHTWNFSYSIPIAESYFLWVHVFRNLLIHRNDIANQIQELLEKIVRECELWLNDHKTGHESDYTYYHVLMQSVFWSSKDVKKLLNIWCRRILRVCSKLWLMRIGTRGTTPHGLRRPKEGSATSQSTIQKIPEDHDVLSKV